jgi:hypothetical protein
MWSVRVLEAAAAEAAEAAAWYEDQRRGPGGEFRSEFKVAVDRLREGVVAGTSWPGPLGTTQWTERSENVALLAAFAPRAGSSICASASGSDRAGCCSIGLATELNF